VQAFFLPAQQDKKTPHDDLIGPICEFSVFFASAARHVECRAPERVGKGFSMSNGKTLSGKTAVITGSNSGIGLGIAWELARAGAKVVLNSFTDNDEDHALAEKIAEETGGEARYIQADMSKGDQCRALVEKAGTCDILVNNAGIQHVAGIPEFPVEKWDAIIAINLSSAFHTTAVALPMMREAGWGRVVNIASAHGLTASPYKSAYIAAKHGIVGLTKTTALETAQEHITANAICPGYVLTPIVEKQIPDTMKEYDMTREEVIENVMLTRQPSKEFATVEQIGGTAVFLCSDAAAQITGTTISVDGGWTAL
jgi:3-hydroxybutyrate dehydrogenase